jgi:hypothetical protein
LAAAETGPLDEFASARVDLPRAALTQPGRTDLPAQPAVGPPSMCKISPVMYGEDSRNNTPSTTSLTCPGRPSGGSWPPGCS